MGTLVTTLATSNVNAADVIRHKIPDSDFPISLAIEIPADAQVVNFSGVVPAVINSKADPSSIAAYGDTETQTVSVLKIIEANLKNLNLSIGDVVKMQVYLVGVTEHGGKMDFAGFMKGYRQFFGTAAQPLLPTRSTFQVAALANPGFLVEIEVTAVRR
ncbi:RidA family protein [Pseudomonas sp. B28(2017)]|uniref:RidA family protein n=1 Tax=Pseudomonas sp. B28(2017) TaxID=1981730 RepID=UPI000A1DCBFF